MMKILIRADGGKTIGMGHIMRTSVLAEELRRCAEVSYVCSEEEEFDFGVNFLRQNGYFVYRFSEENLLSKINDIAYDCMIVDSYNVDANFFKSVKRAGSFLGYIDDLKKEEYPVDFIVNQNPYALDLNYTEENYIETFLGITYVLLRKEFQNPMKRYISPVCKDVLITVGGSDINRITEKIIQNILKEELDMTLHVVIGPAFPKGYLDTFSHPKVKLYYNPIMSDLMKKCDLAVSACGSTVYELAACGTPTIGIVVADNQMMAYEKLKQLGIIKGSNVENILDSIKEMTYEKRLEMSRKGQELVDGLGAKRLASEIFNLINERITGV
ncbi:MAG TPA: UDP-2,4-diacetamido-2,4,6-trideoxy-beta-L-altropyranose hydrolase [Defluviitaleaceae bacterium]|nr:UDP-2,4-diacetamido-2,4,6-trideoxy-beta-L-altropyranose hydrolase [Defluviitaleaceae bacterium]HPT76546.1 UDP-2,4-diacetamido-2,4,6-trideoxy-beta-L-altropyranose hydrolase [Defluviitaleaceae bacterium]